MPQCPPAFTEGQNDIISAVEYFGAVDIGGTHIRVGFYPRDALKPSIYRRIRTRQGSADPLNRLIALLEELWPSDGEVKGIGLAAPGFVEPYQGVVFFSPNIPEWTDLPLKERIQGHFSTPTALGNDANLAALAESRFGAGQGADQMIYLTISTGIGAGVISDGRLVLGARGLATELGHMTVLPDGPLCGCGKRGHLEALASGTAIARYVHEKLEQGVPSKLAGQAEVTAKQVGQAAVEGDALAIDALTTAGHYLGVGLAELLHIFNPSLIVMGGGVSVSLDFLMHPMLASIEERIISPEYTRDLKIIPSALGDNAGLLGALALAQQLA